VYVEDGGATGAGLEKSYLTKKSSNLGDIMFSSKASMGSSGKFEAE
jgi:hypothetical protein